MTTRAEIEALIKRLNGAKEGSADLNNAVRRIVTAIAPEFMQERGAWCANCGADFTRSVDAALTLVPEGLCWRYDSALGYAEIFDLARSPILVAQSGDAELTTYPPALALCIASLRARLSSMKDDANG